MPASSDILKGRRIAIVLSTFDLGGAERQAIHLASYLQDRRGANVAVVALFGGTGEQRVRTLCTERRLPCLRVSMPEHTHYSPSFRSIRQFARDLRALAPEILLPYTALPNVLCGLTWKIAGATTCIWNQRDEGHELPREHWQIAAIANTPAFISNSRGGIEHLASAYKIESSRIHLIPNGVELPTPSESREALRHRLGIAPEAFTAVMLANIHPFKDHETLVRAWKILSDRVPASNPTLLLAGKPIDTQSLSALIARLALTERVRMLGPVHDVSSLLHACDLSVLSSESEGLPNAILESMAAGVPVVATDIPGCRDALGPEYPYLFAPKNADQFAAMIHEFEADPAERRTIGESLRHRAQAEFTIEYMSLKSCAVIQNALHIP